MKIYKGTLVKKICIVSAFFGECQLKVLIVKKKYVWGGEESILIGGTLVKERKWYCASFPHKYDSCVESAFKFF